MTMTGLFDPARHEPLQSAPWSDGAAGAAIDCIVDAVLAKSWVFGVLSSEQRRRIIAQFALEWFEAGQLVLNEGELSDHIYMIKDGEAEVYTEQGGERRSLSTLGPGTLFGEVAALRQIPRTASVVARTRVETLRLRRPGLFASLPQVRHEHL